MYVPHGHHRGKLKEGHHCEVTLSTSINLQIDLNPKSNETPKKLNVLSYFRFKILDFVYFFLNLSRRLLDIQQKSII